MSLDVTDFDAVKALPLLYPDVTLVVNNARYLASGSSLDNFESAVNEMNVNYLAPLAIVQSFAPFWRKSILLNNIKGSSKDTHATTAVINISSIGGLINLPGGATYSASKAAAHLLTQAQRRDLFGYSLVVGVYPGPIDTDMGARFSETSPPSAVANAVVDALTQGAEDVFPDTMPQKLYQ